MYSKQTNGLLKHFDFVILDLLCLFASFMGVYVLFASSNLSRNPFEEDIYRNMLVLIELVSLIVMYFNNTMKDVLKRGYYREFHASFKQAFYVFVLSVFLLFLVKGAQQYSRTVFILTFVFYPILAYVTRLLWKRLIRRKKNAEGESSLLIITNKKDASALIRSVTQQNFGRYRIAGLVICDQDMEGAEIDGIPVVATRENAAMYVCRNWVDEVFISASDHEPGVREMMDELFMTGVTLHRKLAKLAKMEGKTQIVEELAGYSVLTTSMNMTTPVQLAVKRAIDIVGGIVGCIITGIIFIIFGPIIYISSPGPIFFSQERVGKNGKKFKIYKFRSMYMDAEERKAELMKQNKISSGTMFKMDFDPRVIGNKILPDGTQKTGIGQFIRDMSLDEFPQFYNVLKGDMSIIGTRPPLPGEVNLYELHHRARLAIKPGITGMWQVSGRSGITDFEEVVELDRKYINNWSLGLDIKIVLKTIAVVLKRDGAS